MKLWDKGYTLDKSIEDFTVGKDRELDLLLAPSDILGTMAHVTMLAAVGLLSGADRDLLLPELRRLYGKAVSGGFVIEEGIEDVHSQVELELTRALGDVGKKVHTGRSRNDQIMLDLKLFTRTAIASTVEKVRTLFGHMLERSEELKEVLMPGYTHLQVAMPSSFGLWFGAYAEGLADDLLLLHAAWERADRNPLGAAAGYGSSAPLDREMTTRLLGFADLDVNAVHAMLGRGKFEWTVATAYASLAQTLGRFAADGCMFMSQNFGFIHLPDNLTTGSSIMPHKKNPDVFELIRSHCNRIQGIPDTIRGMVGNLPSGYFRDMQLIKEVYLPLFGEMDQVLDILDYAVCRMTVERDLMARPLYATAFSVEQVNRLVADGVPFREAYRRVADAISAGTFRPSFGPASASAPDAAAGSSLSGTAPFRAGSAPAASDLGHTHIGSVGHPGNDRIAAKMDAILAAFSFDKVRTALDALLGGNE